MATYISWATFANLTFAEKDAYIASLPLDTPVFAANSPGTFVIKSNNSNVQVSNIVVPDPENADSHVYGARKDNQGGYVMSYAGAGIELAPYSSLYHRVEGNLQVNFAVTSGATPYTYWNSFRGASTEGSTYFKPNKIRLF